MKFDMGVIKQREMAEAVCSNMLDIHFDMVNELGGDSNSLQLMNDLLHAVLVDKSELSRQLMEGNGSLMLPARIMDEVESTQDPNLLFVVTDHNGNIWTTFTAIDVEF
jgi:hypothetical protein